MIDRRTNKGDARRRHTKRCLARTMRSLSTDTMGDTTSALSRGGCESLHSSTTSSAEGLRMAQDFTHAPVLLDEVAALFSGVPSGVVIDATLGGAGHASRLLASRPDLGLMGLDRDAVARAAALTALAPFGARAVVIPSRFSVIAEVVAAGRAGDSPWPVLDGVPMGDRVVGILADLGVSSPQIDEENRGFSFSQDGPLDMRMDPSAGMTASELLDQIDEHSLISLLRDNGEDRHARRIARAILAQRPITTTAQLVEVIDRAGPRADRRRGHVASRVFQGLRIAVNDELGELDALLDASVTILSPAGRLVVISYHSGEDARVKHTMRRWAEGDCTCPPGMPCVCNSTTIGTLVGRRAVMATETEIARNPRARSARLRTFEADR